MGPERGLGRGVSGWEHFAYQKKQNPIKGLKAKGGGILNLGDQMFDFHGTFSMVLPLS